MKNACSKMTVKRDWFLVYTKSRQEKTAQLNLERQGYSCYLPFLKAKKRKKTSFEFSIEPLFPRYLFIALDAGSDNWSPIRSTKGVISLVRFGLTPAKVPQQLIELIKNREEQFIHSSFQAEDFKSGDPVKIVEGILEGYQGIFERSEEH